MKESFFLLNPRVDSTIGSNKNNDQDDNRVGEGCYISATVNSKRYYGLLVDQSVLKAASSLHFQNEADDIELNRRMHVLQEERERLLAKSQTLSTPSENEMNGGVLKRPATNDPADLTAAKRVKLQEQKLGAKQIVQKFRYMNLGKGVKSCYRELVATYASLDDVVEVETERGQAIAEACQSGGGYVGDYYYQFEVLLFFADARLP